MKVNLKWTKVSGRSCSSYKSGYQLPLFTLPLLFLFLDNSDVPSLFVLSFFNVLRTANNVVAINAIRKSRSRVIKNIISAFSVIFAVNLCSRSCSSAANAAYGPLLGFEMPIMAIPSAAINEAIGYVMNTLSIHFR